MTDYRPISGKCELHLTYRCTLQCRGCSRASWLDPPHTADMTMADVDEFMRQADDLGWRDMPGPAAPIEYRPSGHEPPRVIVIGGEPTIHPDFLEVVGRVTKWSGTYVEVFSNGYEDISVRLCEVATERFSASINKAEWKSAGSRTGDEPLLPFWHREMYVSPLDAGLDWCGPCYCHSSQICGVGIDHGGYSLCPIGCTIGALLPETGARTSTLADCWDERKAEVMTRAMCGHCGYAITHRANTATVARFKEYAATLPRWRGVRISPTWEKAFAPWRESTS